MSVDLHVYIPDRPVTCGSLSALAKRRGWVVRLYFDEYDEFPAADSLVCSGNLAGASAKSSSGSQLAKAEMLAEVEDREGLGTHCAL